MAPGAVTLFREVSVGDALLGTWSTDGGGPAVVLLHPRVGHGDLWKPQHRALADLGWHVISYSRRGHRGTRTQPGSPPTSGTDDLLRLADVLDLDRFHLVGSAFGGFHALDVALRHPQRLISLVLSSSLGGLRDEEWVAATRRLLPPAWHALPPEIRELGPAYRASDPGGVAEWRALVADHELGDDTGTGTDLVLADLRRIQVPTLVITGDADPYLPPPRMRRLAEAIPGARHAVVAEAGHQPAWERPEAWNAMVHSFLSDPS